VVHLSAPAGGAWVVRDHTGERLCSLPCKVDLDSNEAVVIARDNGTQQFVIHQENLGAGAWSGAVRARHEPSASALAVQALSTAMTTAGTTLLQTKREDRIGAGLVLSGLGAVGILASNAFPTRAHEELWLERMATP
jgi:hypothetical protein